ncbi:hypothetical protein Taro_039285, partial [Colocasia esculenta]|nr:hypothetical protein [Colocasia esculenta]
MAQSFFSSTLTLLPIIFFVCVIHAPTTSHAWGPLGHNIICSIAQGLMTRHARREVNRLLGSRNLKDVCTWADDVRDRPGYAWSKQLHYANIQDDQATAFDYNSNYPSIGLYM